MIGLKKGRYVTFEAKSLEDIRAAQRLRHIAFKGSDGYDVDEFDDIESKSVMSLNRATGEWRGSHLRDEEEVSQSNFSLLNVFPFTLLSRNRRRVGAGRVNYIKLSDRENVRLLHSNSSSDDDDEFKME